MVGVLATIGFQTFQVVRRVATPDLYALKVTAGVTNAALVSDDRDVIWNLSAQVAAAINNPALEFRVEVRGDIVFGDKIDGDVIDGDKIVYGG
ncbi:hypothetical protein KOI35_07895 [Actinoplanes bogorensis]|uniref:Uncharacterized protein n=1 Tax=Paractinoplanes bogorensis TaxID=1610840 RepID=A0ABS5YIY1_9ACTN|nr:hypothetical protein [Actinoplanes bogorensis]